MRPTFIAANGHTVIQADNTIAAVLINFDNNAVDWALNQDGSAASTHSASEIAYLKVGNDGISATAIQIELGYPVKKGASLYSMGQGSLILFEK
jgi:hypothetical protein